MVCYSPESKSNIENWMSRPPWTHIKNYEWTRVFTRCARCENLRHWRTALGYRKIQINYCDKVKTMSTSHHGLKNFCKCYWVWRIRRQHSNEQCTLLFLLWKGNFAPTYWDAVLIFQGLAQNTWMTQRKYWFILSGADVSMKLRNSSSSVLSWLFWPRDTVCQTFKVVTNDSQNLELDLCRTITAVETFIGLWNIFCPFLPRFASIEAPTIVGWIKKPICFQL